MFKNYFYLQRIVTELHDRLIGSTIKQIYSQERDKLFLDIGTDKLPHRHLILSVDQNLPFIVTKDEHHRAKKNIVTFFDEYLLDKITNLEIANDDRIIKISLERSTIYYFLRGSKSNVIIANNNSIDSFKKTKGFDPEILVEEFKQKSFSHSFKLPFGHSPDDANLSYDNIRKKYPQLSAEIIRESKLRNGKGDLSLLDSLTEVISEIQNDEIGLYFDENLTKTMFLPINFHLIKNAENVVKCRKYESAIRELIKIKFKNERFFVAKKEVDKYLTGELEKLSKKLNNLKGRIEKGSRENEYRNFGNLLLSNRYLLTKGMEEISVTDYISQNDFLIKLDPKLSPQQNIDKYFEKAKDEKINYEKSVGLFQISESRYNLLIESKSIIDTTDSLDEIEEIKKRFKLKSLTQKLKQTDDTIRFRHFIIEDKYHVFVGKDNKNNDLLTMKFAKQNDYWFHARSVPGSHVVLRVDNPKEGIPKNILKNVASIAAYYSKAKTSGVSPVSYTFAKYVHKKKGMEPGKVMLSKENTLLVRPEIPNNCEQVEND